MMIKKGSKVIIIGSAEEQKYQGCIFEVLSEPYTVSGTLVVKMKCHETGKYFAGGYAVEFLGEVPNESNIKEAIIKIALHYGLDKQLIKLQEELAELIKAIAVLQLTDSNRNIDNLVDETADVGVVLEQIMFLLGIDVRVAARKNYKLDRQLKRIEAEPFLY